jgi:hypothetical protein
MKPFLTGGRHPSQNISKKASNNMLQTLTSHHLIPNNTTRPRILEQPTLSAYEYLQATAVDIISNQDLLDSSVIKWREAEEARKVARRHVMELGKQSKGILRDQVLQLKENKRRKQMELRERVEAKR